MTLDITKVAVAVTGLVSRAPLATAAPTTQATSLNVAFVDLGLIGEGGVTSSIAASGDVNYIKAWQNGQTVRTLRTSPDDNPTWTFVLLETKKEVLESYFGSAVTQTATEGALTINTTSTRTHYSWVFDVVDGAELERTYVPDGCVIEVGDRVYANQEPIGYEVTVEGYYNAGITGQAKFWTTRAKT